MEKEAFNVTYTTEQKSFSETASFGEGMKKCVNYREQFMAFLRKDKFSEYGAERFIDLLTSFVDFYISVVANSDHRTV